MRTPLVRGLMSATFLSLGTSCVFALRAGIAHHAATHLIVIYACGVLVLPLALWLLTDSRVAFGISFALLLFLASIFVLAPIWERFTTSKPRFTLFAGLGWATIYAFPCIVAVALSGRAATRESNQTMKLTATAARFADAASVATFLFVWSCLCASGGSLSCSR